MTNFKRILLVACAIGSVISLTGCDDTQANVNEYALYRACDCWYRDYYKDHEQLIEQWNAGVIDVEYCKSHPEFQKKWGKSQ